MTSQYNEYYKKHRSCPQCGSLDIRESLVGFAIKDSTKDCDRNSATCIKCGWKGIVHDLKEPL